MSIQSVSQQLDQDPFVTLFRLDTQSLGGPIMSFVQSRFDSAPVSFAGVVYDPVDVIFEGLETSGVAGLPTPRMRVSNTNGVFQAILNTYGDPLGCPLYRVRTYQRFLDGQPNADPNAYFGPDIFAVERRASETSKIIEFELSSSIDQEGKMIPGRQVIRDTCLWRYRSWNAQTQTFDYSKAQCPYTGTTYFDINDQPVAGAANDKPSRRLNCCKVRFGANKPLPFGGFPGSGRVRA